MCRMEGVENSCIDFSKFPQTYAAVSQSQHQLQFANDPPYSSQNVTTFTPFYSTTNDDPYRFPLQFDQHQFKINPNEYQNLQLLQSARFVGDSSSQTQTSGIPIMPKGSYSYNRFTNDQILLQLKHKLLDDDDLDDYYSDKVSLPYDANHDFLHFGHYSTATTSGNYNSVSSSSSSTKTRVRWSEDLHGLFVDCVNKLGGPDKATPKAILTLMNKEWLTILHIKSHLQKYRNVIKHVPAESVLELGTSENLTRVARIDMETGMQLKEALLLQVDVQKSLHEQLEIQQKLQARIEEQGKKLKMMIEQQHKSYSSPTLVEDPEANLVSQGSLR